MRLAEWMSTIHKKFGVTIELEGDNPVFVPAKKPKKEYFAALPALLKVCKIRKEQIVRYLRGEPIGRQCEECGEPAKEDESISLPSASGAD